jgi:hypothetical protein
MRVFADSNLEADPDKYSWEDTPRSISVKAEGDVPSLRAKMGDANEQDVLECDVETFMSHYLPFQPPQALIDAAMNALEAKEIVLPHKSGHGRKDPASTSSEEPTTSTHTASPTNSLAF